ncbi:hypothetical protein [Spirosoma aerolatum]|uniref:hypothetical protein n=1 Tax=Spirosoma aerolatum TaxID=1211326 RepID=UPI0009AD02B0|nr:hypothetical protein [Spirosoma aerolatum]
MLNQSSISRSSWFKTGFALLAFFAIVAFLARPSTSSPPVQNNTTRSIIGETGAIKLSCYGGRTEAYLLDATEAQQTKNELNRVGLLKEGKIIPLTKDTKALILEKSDFLYKISLLDGPFRGQNVYIHQDDITI